ncbi:hypothetical protein VZQ01_06450 [Myxococcus faecalis]|uniref:hypothetical protein n=1 Tax=Myxococcus TaxID=32 RepID=UPI001CC0BEFC|nr:hypothetical protein [Myxococcus sp. XM-1-1-1]BDT32865.1 hypothetical protein MFMH1_25340 [Myxococcus sp. MH1]
MSQPPLGGAGGTAASVSSNRQAVVSPALEAALACVEGYVAAGTCDWAHWSEMWETCRTYEHAELEDGLFLEEVQSDACTADNWAALRAKLLAPRLAPVVLRDDCHGDSTILQESSANGCYALPAGAGASYVDVAIGKAVTLHAGADCSGDSVTVETSANLCETSFASGASANDGVRSYRVQDVEAPASPYRYTCSASEPACVENHNKRLGAINKKHTVKVVRVTYAGRSTPSLSDIRNNVRDLYSFFGVASGGQVGLEITASQTVEVTSANCSKAKNQAVQKARSNAFLTVYSMPSGMCSVSNAGSNRVFLKGGLFRDYAHEVGHVLGLAHGNTRNPTTGEVDHYGDSSTYMGSNGSDNYNLPQLHWLGWTKKEDLVQVNSVVDNGGTVDITLRPVGRNAESSNPHPLGAVWDIPGTDQRLFIAVPKPRLNGSNQIEGGTVFVYRAPKCVGCTGMAMGTMVMARFGAESVNEHEVQGLFIRPVPPNDDYVVIREDGKNIKVFNSVTLRIRR